jgi:hypothetical protein
VSETQQAERKAQPKAPPSMLEPKTHAEVVYTPLDPGDPHETEFAGIKFRANVAVQVPLARTVNQLQRKEHYTTEGDLRSRSIEVKTPIVEALRNNPHFRIDGEQAVRDRPHSKVPDSPEGYRGYAIAWIALSKGAKEMKMRWEMEKPLRHACGVDKTDIEYIMPLFESKFDELAAQAQAA